MNLKTLFELRQTKALKSRLSQARIFLYKNSYGLCDASGYLWPISFKEHSAQLNLHSGDIILFSSIFQYQSSACEENNILTYILVVEEILAHTINTVEWDDKIIPDPIPFLNSVVQSTIYTCYYPSYTKKRFQLLQTRMQALERVKQFFINRSFLAIDSPILVPSGGLDIYLNSFITNYISYQQKQILCQLPTSPELSLKKILGELPLKIFQLAKSFRNIGELSKWHEPEFLILEWYRVGAKLTDILDDTEKLVKVLHKFLGSHLKLPQSWPRFEINNLFKKILNLDLNALQEVEEFYQAAKPLSISILSSDTWDDIFCKLFMEKIEPYLKEQKACFVTHYPRQMSALSAKSPNKNFCERAEAFVDGIEICNAYLELTDAGELQTRITEAQNKNNGLKRDLDFEKAMAFGLAPCAGNALGLDRVIAILLGLDNISILQALDFASRFKIEQN